MKYIRTERLNVISCFVVGFFLALYLPNAQILKRKEVLSAHVCSFFFVRIRWDNKILVCFCSS